MPGVSVLDEKRMIPAYGFPAAEELPMFAENRVHQRSSGNPWPNRVVLEVDRKNRADREFRVITLENEYLRIELLPELGGRIFSALDKRTGYDFFYRQHVIKPALIGLLGSWISGGCEFNWPCHHRPSTFMPVDVDIERHPDGSATVWMSENEPLDRMKGMVGIFLAPGEAWFDTRMKVYNPTPVRHSFLWWENAAVPVNRDYRLVFPPDVHYVQFHYRKNVTTYPVASGVYNGIRMGQGTDISQHKNTLRPTSYFCAATKYDFFGGYDEGRRCGVIHVADRTVSVGKKMFTWAYSQLSASWEKALTDTDGAYAELMASSYSLNQPDFAWLMPYEEREFSQMWYPVGDIGTPLCACREAAVAAENGTVCLQANRILAGAELILNGKSFRFDASPDRILRFAYDGGELDSLLLRNAAGRTLLRYERGEDILPTEMPATIPDNPTLDRLKTAQELYLAGVHAEQYRDPAVRPDRYWREAVRRDPEYVPALTALARYELDRFRPEEALALAGRAWKKVTFRNFHPESGELQYTTGRILEALDRDAEALEWYMQAAWAQDARSRALTRAAMTEGRRHNTEAMEDLCRKALREYPGNSTARHGLILSLGSRPAEQERELAALLESDRLDPVGRYLKLGPVPAFYQSLLSDARQTALDIAGELVSFGAADKALRLLEKLPGKTAQTEYVRAYLAGERLPDGAAAGLGVGVAYPSRVLEYRALKAAAEGSSPDPYAMNLLACLLYANENHAAAATLWEKALAAAPDSPDILRNLAVARYSHLGRREDALPLLDKALALRPHDGQLIMEKAHVMTRTGRVPAETARFLLAENNPREDITTELCRALNLSGQYEKTLEIMLNRSFTPCEGGEHAVAEQYMFAHHALGLRALHTGRTEEALEQFRQAQVLPDCLGAGLWNEVRLVPHRYFEALCLKKLGREDEAAKLIDWILILKQDYFSDMNLPELPCWQAMALKLAGREAEARELLAAHLRSADAAAAAVDPGYKGTTPFFISYMEDAAAQRKAGCDWQRAMIAVAAGDARGASVYAARSLENDPSNLYATLLR